jgi:hypothetical protein
VYAKIQETAREAIRTTLVRIKRSPCFRLGKPEQGSRFFDFKERILIKTEEPRRRKTPKGRELEQRIKQ